MEVVGDCIYSLQPLPSCCSFSVDHERFAPLVRPYTSMVGIAMVSSNGCWGPSSSEGPQKRDCTYVFSMTWIITGGFGFDFGMKACLQKSPWLMYFP
jgi:hypothetical protein